MLIEMVDRELGVLESLADSLLDWYGGGAVEHMEHSPARTLDTA